MRKILISFAAFLMTISVFAGGLVTNSNQSALFTRLQNRNASTSVDAVYYNPAGLTNLGEGFFVSINNQFITQTQTISSDLSSLNGTPREFIGNVKAPLFPSAYAALNVGNLSFSFGFNPIGGGGSAKFSDGLPSFEGPVSVLPVLLPASLGINNYEADILFEGSSVYKGFQFNTGYRINHLLSVAGGIRIVTAKNTYEGFMKTMVDPGGVMVSAPGFFKATSETLATLSSGATQYATALQPIVTGGGGGVLLSNGTVVGLTAQQIATIQQMMGAAGLTQQQVASATIQNAQQVLTAAAPTFSQNSVLLNAISTQTADRLVNVKQDGFGYTPILSVNISAAEDLNIALRYEFKTKLRLKEHIINNEDGGGLFTEGRTIIADIPAQLAFGFEYNPVNTLKIAGTFNTYFDQDVDYDGSSNLTIDMIDRNFYEYGLGLEYGFGPNFRASAGWVATSTGVNSNYQSDRRFSVNTNSFGAGVGYRISRNIDLNIGGQYTLYGKDSKIYDSPLGIVPNKYTETYTKNTLVAAIGLDFLFGVK